MKRRFVNVAAAIVLASPLAGAQGTAQDKAVASQLFDDADKLMAAGKIAEACPKYEESQRLDPQLGTLLHLGECLDRQGRVASAWASFKDALEIAHQRSDPREAKVRARLAELEPRVPKLAINVGATAPADLEVKRDGAVVGRPVWGALVPVDPGEHVVTASAPGRIPWTQHVTVAPGTKTPVTVPELAMGGGAGAPTPVSSPAPSPAPAPVSAAGAPGEPGPAPAAPPGDSTHKPGKVQRTLGWVAVGAGVVGVAVGTVFTLQRGSKLSDRDDICPSGVNCEPGSQSKIDSLTDDARSAQTLGTVGFVAGGALAALGVTLILTAPHGEGQPGAVAIAPAVSPSCQGLMLSGSL